MPTPTRPKGEYTQSVRLLELYDRLHRGESLRPEETARSLGVHRRTVYRDLAVLSRVLADRLERLEEPDGRVRWRLARDPDRWGVTESQVLAGIAPTVCRSRSTMWRCWPTRTL